MERINKAKERLNAYYEAEIAVLAGQSYQIGTRSLTRADLGVIRKAIKELENLVQELENAGKRKAVRITLRDL